MFAVRRLVAPNRRGPVVFCVLDDGQALDVVHNASHNAIEMGIFGITLQIPNIRRLLRESTYFRNMNAPIPQCKPARTSLTMGQYPTRTACWDNSHGRWFDLVDLTQSYSALIRDHGFFVYGAGKLAHEVVPDDAVLNACFSEYGKIRAGAIVELELVSLEGLSAEGGSTYSQLELTPYEASGTGGRVNVTVDRWGTGIASLVVTEADAMTIDLGQSGSGYEVGDLVRHVGFGGAHPGAEMILRVVRIGEFFPETEAGEYRYGLDADPYVELGDDLLTERLAETLAGLKDRSGRLIQFGLKGPHLPNVVPQKYLDMHPLENITIPADYPVADSWVLRYLSEYPAQDLVDAGKLEERLQYFAAAIELMDAHIGRVIDALEEAGLWGRTTFILASDHGYMHGDRAFEGFAGSLEKGVPYGNPARCLSLIRSPWHRGGQVIEEPVSLIDLAPTLLEIYGIPVPVRMHGQSLMPALRMGNGWRSEKTPLVFNLGNTSSQARIEGPEGYEVWRLVAWFNGTRELYREDIDPLNKVNFWNDPAFAAQQTEMVSRHATALSSLGDLAPVDSSLVFSGGEADEDHADTYSGGDVDEDHDSVYDFNTQTTGTDRDDLFLAYAQATGNMVLQGGVGDDTYILGDPAIQIEEAPDGGRDTVIGQWADGTTVSFTLPENVENFFSDPTASAAVITGNADANMIAGVLATVYGGGGADTIVAYYEQTQALYAEGGAGDDYIQGAAGDDHLLGGDGDDTLVGIGGDDTLEGGAGHDDLRGGADSDTLRGDAGDDTLTGGGGDDVLEGGDGADLIIGGAGDDSIDGGEGSDTIHGQGGDDTITGGGGSDFITAGRGANTVSGGSGGDIFRYGNDATNLIITDFTPDDGDVIWIDPGPAIHGLTGFAAVVAAAKDTVFGLQITGAQGVITIRDREKAEILPSWFVFDARDIAETYALFEGDTALMDGAPVLYTGA